MFFRGGNSTLLCLKVIECKNCGHQTLRQMDDINKPVFGLSVQECIELTRKIVSEELEKAQLLRKGKSKLHEDDDDVIFAETVTKITGYTIKTLYTKVSRLEIPVISRKKPLTFSRKEIMEWMRDGKPSVIDRKAQEYLFKKKIAH